MKDGVQKLFFFELIDLCGENVLGKQNEEGTTTAPPLDDQAKKGTRKLLDKQNRLKKE
jgi:hypothetical protein